ncbi:hypothetical protein ABZW96_11790 [Nocardia sp. NPDC004168]|uniref:hypothetical protein n=1 Tax=Nocardia sp. NPDC004168 TaxID=3154452 RepID=UPI0033A6980D
MPAFRTYPIQDQPIRLDYRSSEHRAETGAGAVEPDANPIIDDWVNLLVDRTAHDRDNRPIMLCGLSAGGMLVYHVDTKPQGGLSGTSQHIRQVRNGMQSPTSSSTTVRPGSCIVCIFAEDVFISAP